MTNTTTATIPWDCLPTHVQVNKPTMLQREADLALTNLKKYATSKGTELETLEVVYDTNSPKDMLVFALLSRFKNGEHGKMVFGISLQAVA